MEGTITQDELKQLVHYDRDTGIFTRLVTTSSRAMAGMEIGHPEGLGGHLRATVGGRKHYLHRLAWLYEHGEMPEMIDHIDMDVCNNRISNLRLASKSDNNCNRNAPITNTSGVKGICWDADNSAWLVQVQKSGRKVKKRFKEFADAVQWRIQMADVLHGEFAREG